MARGASRRPRGRRTREKDGSELPALLTRDRGRRLRPGDVLYRLYVTLLLGGIYGGAVVHAIVTVPTPSPTASELAQLGLVLSLLPGTAVLLGTSLGSWVGLVAVTPAEAAVLLPTPVSRRALLRGRAWRTVVVLMALLAVVAVVAVALLALQRDVDDASWVHLPLAAVGVAALLAAIAVLVQCLPAQRHRVPTASLVGTALVSLPVALALTETGRGGLQALATHVLAGARTGLTLSVTTAATTGCIAAAAGAITRLDGIHDEPLRARAGARTGVAASLRLGDVRAIRLSRDPTSRARPLHTRRPPRRVSGVVRWRHLVAHRARPAGVARVVVGWAAATGLLTAPDPPTTAAAVVLRTVVAAAVAAAATVPLLEPMRRDHDAPLAAELIPLGYAALQRAHIRAALRLGLVVIVPTTAVTTWVSAPELPWWVGPAGGLFAGTCAVLAAADRVRQPGSVAESMAAMPMGATPEVLGVALAGTLLLPVVGLVPAALPVGLVLAAPLLDADVAPLAAAGTAVGAALLALRTLGLSIWFQAAETTLADASAPEPGSSLPLAWRRLRDRRR